MFFFFFYVWLQMSLHISVNIELVFVILVNLDLFVKTFIHKFHAQIQVCECLVTEAHWMLFQWASFPGQMTLCFIMIAEFKLYFLEDISLKDHSFPILFLNGDISRDN